MQISFSSLKPTTFSQQQLPLQQHPLTTSTETSPIHTLNMADPTVPPFDPNADMMFFAGMNEQQTFTMSPANVTNEFIEQSKLNIAAARSAPSSEARSVPAPDTEEPVFVPIRPAVTATSATGTSAKKRKRMTVTNADELPGANGKAAMATSPEPAATIVPWGLPPTLKRKRQPGKKQMNARVIPRSLAECDEADKELITLRDAGSEWKVIRGRWLELTGEKTATSTLPNRYARLK